MNKKLYEAFKIILNDKVEFEGSSEVRKLEFWKVAGHSVHYATDLDTYVCTCRDCSVTRIPNGLDSRCCYVLALKIYKFLEQENKE
jgi:hypothetical protein